MGGFFTSKESKLVSTNNASSGKTVAYVDGYNLYYGRLRGTRFKWFDLVKFFDALLLRRDQNEEKKTDVNLAIRMYRDAAKRQCDRMILMSNDSDAEPALAAIRMDFEEIMIGLVTPVHPPVSGKNVRRRSSGSLSKYSHWNTTHLTDEQLDDAQLPPTVPTKKKPIRKPLHW